MKIEETQLNCQIPCLELIAEGIAEIAVGAEELGEAAVMADVADTLEDVAEEA